MALVMVKQLAKICEYFDQVLTCDRCGLCRTATKKAFDRSIVMYAEAFPIPVLFIGMAPAYTEDRTGVPLTGGWEIASSRCGCCTEVGNCYAYFLHRGKSYKEVTTRCPYKEGDMTALIPEDKRLERLARIVNDMAYAPETTIFNPLTAGQLFNYMLRASGLVRATEVDYADAIAHYKEKPATGRLPNCTMMNLVQCWAFDISGGKPCNRKASAEEVTACRPLVEQYIELIQPKVIVTLGTQPREVILGKDAIMGKEHRSLFNVPVIPMYHPSYYLHTWDDPGREARVNGDIALLKHIHEVYVK